MVQELGLGRRGELRDGVAVREQLDLPSTSPGRRCAFGPAASAMSWAIRSTAASKHRIVHLVERGLGQADAGLEQLLQERLLRPMGCFSLYFSSKNSKFFQWSKIRKCVLSLPGPNRFSAEPGAAADHLPELDVGVHRLGEDEVDDLGHVDAGVEHVHRDGDGQVGVLGP